MLFASSNVENQKQLAGISWQSYLAILCFIYALLEFIPVFSSLNIYAFTLLAGSCIIIHFVWKRNLILDIRTSEAYLFLCIWLAYSFLSILWADNSKHVLDYSFLIIRYVPIFIIFTQFFFVRKYQKLLIIFYQIVVMVYLGIAIWELSSGQHLPSSKWFGTFFPYPTGPFYGENMLAAFWLLLLPYLTVPTCINKGWFLSTLTILIILAIYIIIILQGARIAMIAIALGGIIYLVRWASRALKIGFIALLIIIPLYFAHNYPVIWNALGKYAEEQITSIHTESQSASMSSIKIRVQLIKEGIDMFVQYGLVGVGSGNFEDIMRHGRMQRAGGMTNPHNYSLEILGDFGIMIFLGFLFLYLYWLYCLWHLIKKGEEDMRPIYRAHFFSLLMFIPASALPSSIRFYYLVWIYFAGVHATCITGMAKLNTSTIKTDNQELTDF